MEEIVDLEVKEHADLGGGGKQTFQRIGAGIYGGREVIIPGG